MYGVDAFITYLARYGQSFMNSFLMVSNFGVLVRGEGFRHTSGLIFHPNQCAGTNVSCYSAENQYD